VIVHSADVNASVKRSGITLTEILISILIMGIGMVSLATLFPLGLLKLRDAARMSRSTYLAESATADLTARGLLNPTALAYPDVLNNSFSLPLWYMSPNGRSYNPLVQDTPRYGGNWIVPPNIQGAQGSNGQGLPFAYDPLWRYQTVWNSQAIWGVPSGIYLDPLNQFRQRVPEARFASGIGFIRPDPDGNGSPSAHGLQRLTNFNTPAAVIGGTLTPIMPMSQYVPSICVSPEDVVWQDPEYKFRYSMAGILGLTDPVSNSTVVDPAPSALVPDLSQSSNLLGNPLPLYDWRYTWMFTGRQVSTGSAAGVTFDGEIVIFENRPFALENAANAPFVAQMGPWRFQPAGEQVVEAVFGYSTNVVQVGVDVNGDDVYYGVGAPRSVLLRWPAATPDPEIRVGGWIADVTYERTYALSASNLSGTRFPTYTPTVGLSVPAASGQRCLWYQVVKVNPPANDLSVAAHRSMVVNVATPLRAYTRLNPNGTPFHVNAALVSPHVVQVVPRTFTVN
jgi:hypothetical protein